MRISDWSSDVCSSDLILAFIDAGRAVEGQDGLVHPRRLHDAAFRRDIAEQHGQPAILGEGVFRAADHAGLAVGVQFLPTGVLAERLGGADAAGGGARSEWRCVGKEGVRTCRSRWLSVD